MVSCKNAGAVRVDPWAVPASKKRKATVVDMENIPSQVVPRGIAKRLRLSKFLDALKIGIVVRRHKPQAEAQFVKLFTDDGGDTIQ